MADLRVDAAALTELRTGLDRTARSAESLSRVLRMLPTDGVGWRPLAEALDEFATRWSRLLGDVSDEAVRLGADVDHALATVADADRALSRGGPGSGR